MQQIERIISLSEHCEQFVSFTCLGVPLNRRLPSDDGGDAAGSGGSESTEPVAWWTDRKGEIHFYWNADGGNGGMDQSGVHQVQVGLTLYTGKVNLLENSIRSSGPSTFPYNLCSFVCKLPDFPINRVNWTVGSSILRFL